MLATLTLFLGLPLALATEPQSCARLVSVTLSNTTIPQILGQWFYIAGASRYPPHLEEMRAVTFAVFSFSPSSLEDELNVTEILRMNETCVERNATVQLLEQNSTLTHVFNNQVAAVTRVIQSDEDLLILHHIDTDFPSLSLSARTPNVSKEHMEEFKAQLHCLGFTEEDVFYTSTEYACPLPESEDNEDPQLGSPP